MNVPRAESGVDGARVVPPGLRLRDISEDDLLALIFPRFGDGPSPYVVLGPGDDAAVVAAPDGRVVATTDAMVRGHDWRDEWSTGADVGAKVAAANLADVAAMGAVPTGLLVTLAADPDTPVAWVLDLSSGLADAVGATGAVVVGGDLSAAPAGTVMVSVTAFGDLQGRAPVTRGGATAGDVVAVTGTLGCAAAGLELLRRGRAQEWPELVALQRSPRPPYEQGPAASVAGVHAMLDLSDGLVRDAARLARASGVSIDLNRQALASDVAALTPALGERRAWECVLGGGEEHSLLACFEAEHVPAAWRVIGAVAARAAGLDGRHVPDGGADVTVDGGAPQVQGWDHFGG